MLSVSLFPPNVNYAIDFYGGGALHVPDDEFCPCLCANIFSRRPGYLKYL